MYITYIVSLPLITSEPPASLWCRKMSQNSIKRTETSRRL